MRYQDPIRESTKILNKNYAELNEYKYRCKVFNNFIF